MWFGAPMVNSGELEVGLLSSFFTYITQILASLMMVSMMMMMMTRSIACAKRIIEVLEEQPDITGTPQTRAWMQDLERRTRESLGRKVKITQNDKKKSIELFYDDDADMEALLIALCGKDFFKEN